jgi:hypothetical protein
LGDAAGSITPSRVGTDVGKIACLLRDGIGLGGAAAVIFGDLIIEAVTLVLGGLIVLAIAPFAWIAVVGVVGYAGVTLALGALGVYLASIRTGKEPPSTLSRFRLGRRRWREIRVMARSFLRSSRRLRTLTPSVWLALAGVSIVHFAGRLGVLPVLALGTLGPEAFPALIGWPLGLIWVAGFLPPPSGGGGVEFGFIAALGSTIPEASLAGFLFWWRFYVYYLSATLGLVLGFLVFGSGLFKRIVGGSPSDSS